MQEVRKVVNQETVVEEEKDFWVRLCVVEAAGKVLPVYMSENSFAIVGDMVLFDYNNESYTTIILMEDDARINGPIWKKTIETFGMVPIKAKAFASITMCEWEEDER